MHKAKNRSLLDSSKEVEYISPKHMGCSFEAVDEIAASVKNNKLIPISNSFSKAVSPQYPFWVSSERQLRPTNWRSRQISATVVNAPIRAVGIKHIQTIAIRALDRLVGRLSHLDFFIRKLPDLSQAGNTFAGISSYPQIHPHKCWKSMDVTMRYWKLSKNYSLILLRFYLLMNVFGQSCGGDGHTQNSPSHKTLKPHYIANTHTDTHTT